MRKILILLTSIMLTSTTSSVVISCNDKLNPTDKKTNLSSKSLDTLTIWVNDNTKTKYNYIYNIMISNLNQQLGQKFKLKLEQIDLESVNEQFKSYKTNPTSTSGDLSNGITINITPKKDLNNIIGSCTLNIIIMNKTSIKTLFKNNIMTGIQLKVKTDKPKDQTEIDTINTKIKASLFEQLKSKNQYLTKDDINIGDLNLVNSETQFNTILEVKVKPSSTSAILKQDNQYTIFPVTFNREKIDISSLNWENTLITSKVNNNKQLSISNIANIKNDIKQKIQTFLSNEINGITTKDYQINDIDQKIIPNKDLSVGFTLKIQGTTSSNLINTDSKDINVYLTTNIKNINIIVNNNLKLKVHNTNILIQDDINKWKERVKNDINNTLTREVTDKLQYETDYSISNLNKIRVGQNVSRGINLTVIANTNSKYIWGYKKIKLEFENYNKYDLSSIQIPMYEYKFVLDKSDVITNELNDIKAKLETYLINNIYDKIKLLPDFNKYTVNDIKNDLDLSPITNLKIGDYSHERSLIINSKATSRFMKNNINLRFELVNKTRTDISKINFKDPFKTFKVINTRNITSSEAQNINTQLKQDIVNKISTQIPNITTNDFTITSISPGDIGPNNTIKKITITSAKRSEYIIGVQNINIIISNYNKIDLSSFSFNDLELNVNDPDNITAAEVNQLKQQIPNMVKAQLNRNNKNITTNDFTIPNLDSAIVQGMPKTGTTLNIKASNSSKFLINNGNINIIIKKGPIDLSNDPNVKKLLQKIIIEVSNKSNINQSDMDNIKNNVLPNQIILLLKTITNENITKNDIILENLNNLTPGDWTSKTTTINLKGNPKKTDLVIGVYNNMEISFN